MRWKHIYRSVAPPKLPTLHQVDPTLTYIFFLAIFRSYHSAMAETAIPLDTMPTQNNSTAWATTEEEWSQHQAQIGDLYSQHKLEEVKQIMEQQHDFKAT